VRLPFLQHMEPVSHSSGSLAEESCEEASTSDLSEEMCEGEDMSDTISAYELDMDTILENGDYLDDGVFERLERYGPPTIQAFLERLEIIYRGEDQDTE